MQKEPIDQSIQSNNKLEIQKLLIQQFLQLGFQEKFITQALKYTHDKQKIGQIIIKLVEEGPNTNLTQFCNQVNYDPKKNQLLNLGKQIPNPLPKKKVNRIKMLFIINGQLKMGKGKICAQVGHAVIGAYLQIQQLARFDEKSKIALNSWEFTGGAKIVVKSDSLKQMLEIQKQAEKAGINTYLVEDAGHTQIKAGSKTVLAIGPAYSQEIDPITQHLKLL